MGFTELTKDFPAFSSVPQPGADLDYSRWQGGGSTVILHAVPWADDYTDVVGFASDNARDAWFDDASSHSRHAIAGASYIPYGAGRCRVQLSAARVAMYNYVEIRTDAAPVTGDAFDGQVPPGPTRAYYFIRGFEQLAPDTCELRLDLDVWTTFIHAFRFGASWLERGHVGVASSDVATYLSNPSGHTEWLLAPDVDYGGSHMASSVTPCDMWQGACTVLVGLRASRTWLEAAPTMTVSGGAAVSFYDVTGERWGEDAGVTAAVPVLVGPVDLPRADYGDDLQTTRYYAIGDAAQFFSSLEQSYAYVYNLLEAVYVVPSSFVVAGSSFTALGATMTEVVSLPAVSQSVALAAADFDIDARYADLAKLYTYPYSVLEYRTADGATHEIRVEDTGASLAFASRLAEVDNVLNLQTYLEGANGYGGFSYDWHDDPRTLPKGVMDTLHVRGVPAFEVIVTAKAQTAADSARDLAQKCREIETTYTNGARVENTVELNALAANATNNTNALASNATANTNAQAAAATANGVAYNSADTAKTNAYSNADTAETVAEAEADAVKLNTDDSVTAMVANAGHAQFANTQLNANAQNENGLIEIASTTKVTDDAAADLQYQQDAVNAQLTGVAAAGSTSNIAAAGSTAIGALTGAAVGSIVPGAGTAAGAIVGALFSASGQAISGAAAAVSNTIVITKETAIGNASMANIAAKRDNANAYIAAANTASRTKANNDTSVNNSLIVNQTTENQNATNAISARNLATAYSNAATVNANSKTVADLDNATVKANADAMYATEIANASRTQGTGDANANRTLATADANASYARDAGVLNLQDSARTSYAGLTAQLESAGLHEHKRVTPGADQEPYSFERAFDTITVKTQSAGAIAQAGEYFRTYGYAANKAYTPTPAGFAIAGRNKSYWRFSDVRGTCSAGGNSVRDAVFSILKRGVTVWASPSVMYSE